MATAAATARVAKTGEAATVVGAGAQQTAAPSTPGQTTSAHRHHDAKGRVSSGGKNGHKHSPSSSSSLEKKIDTLKEEKRSLIEALNQLAAMYEAANKKLEVFEKMNEPLEDSSDDDTDADASSKATGDAGAAEAAPAPAAGGDGAATADGVAATTTTKEATSNGKTEGATDGAAEPTVKSLKRDLQRAKKELAQKKLQLNVVTKERLRLTHELGELQTTSQSTSADREEQLAKLKARNAALKAKGKSSASALAAERDSLLAYAQALEVDKRALMDAAKDGAEAKAELSDVRSELARERERADEASERAFKLKHELDWLKSQPGVAVDESEARAIDAEATSRHLTLQLGKLRSGAAVVFDARVARVEEQATQLTTRLRALEARLGEFVNRRAVAVAGAAVRRESMRGLAAHDMARLEARMQMASEDIAKAEALLSERERDRERALMDAGAGTDVLPVERFVRRINRRIPAKSGEPRFVDLSTLSGELTLRTEIGSRRFMLRIKVPEADAWAGSAPNKLVEAAKAPLDGSDVTEDGDLVTTHPGVEWVEITTPKDPTAVVPPVVPRPHEARIEDSPEATVDKVKERQNYYAKFVGSGAESGPTPPPMPPP